MDEISGNLWEWNLAKVVVIDVTDDYRFMLGPMPSDFYPVLKEVWLPRHRLDEAVQHDELVSGYLYDWHETPMEGSGNWYVGVVNRQLTSELVFGQG